MPIQPKQQPPYYTPGSSQPYIDIITITLWEPPTPIIIHQNTTNATITFAKTSTGEYELTASTPIFIEDQTWAILQDNTGTNTITITTNVNDTTSIIINVSNAGTPEDGWLNNNPLEIKIYN